MKPLGAESRCQFRTKQLDGYLAPWGIFRTSSTSRRHLSDVLRGKGMGNRLMETAVEFCRDKGCQRVYLWTFAGLDAARHLCEKHGFELVEQFKGSQWGTRP